MKMNFIYGLFAFLSLALINMSVSGGVARSNAEDRTGSPVSVGGGTFCSSCHGGNAFGTTVELRLLEGDVEVTAYEPGKSYTFQVDINASSGSPSAYGLQAVALDDANSNAGDFASAPFGTTLTNLNGRSYFEHRQPLSENTHEVEWTAPPAGTGRVTFYAAGNAVNGNGGTSGDGAATATLSIDENQTSSLGLLAADQLQMELLGNPVGETLRMDIHSPEGGSYQLSVFDRQGKVAWNQAVQLAPGRNSLNFPLEALVPDLYVLHLTDGKVRQTSRILKQ